MMRINKRINLLAAILFWMAATCYAQSADTLKVLFVGNSYTYFWNLSQTVEELSKNQKTPFVVRQSTAGGASLRDHWEGNKDLNSRAVIKENDWDLIVLQNHSKSSINKLDEFKEYGDRFIELVKSVDAIPILYETWAREFNPLMQDQISSAYEELGKKHNLQIVPVGTIWAKVRDLKPDLKLFDPDGSHPSPTGTYLTACIFYSFLTSQNATGLPERVKTIDKNGEVLYLNIQSKEDAEFLQNAVDRYLIEKRK